MDFGVKYLKTQIDEKTYILIPKDIVVGSSCKTHFYTGHHKIELLSNGSITNDENYVVDSVIEIEKYKRDNEAEDEEFEFIKDYYFCEEKNSIILVNVVDGKVFKTKLNLDSIKNKTTQEIYDYIGDHVAIMLNEQALNKLLSLDDVGKIKAEITRYQHGVESLYDYNRDSSVNRIVVQDGKIASIETGTNLILPDINTQKRIETAAVNVTHDISLSGLVSYINERVFGHDEEAKRIATVLLMNLTAKLEDGTESILIPGPTGVGKTATLEAASEYLSVPFLMINTPNLVPAGIKGETIESNLQALHMNCLDRLDTLERAIVVFDEFDKLDGNDLDIKVSVKPILLKFIEGGDFKIDKDRGAGIVINTKMFSKVFLGSFSDLFKSKKTIGIGSILEEEMDIDVNSISQKYFNKELISRISHIITYRELDSDTKKRVILQSKLSTYLKKRERFARDFGIEIIGDDDFANAIIEKLSKEDKSMRDVNNIINTCLLDAEYEILDNPGKYHVLKLTKDIVDDSKKFDLS